MKQVTGKSRKFKRLTTEGRRMRIDEETSSDWRREGERRMGREEERMRWSE